MGQTEIALIDDIESVDVLAKKTTKRSMMNWVIWRVVRYFFHWKGQPAFSFTFTCWAYPDLGSTGSSVVVVVCK
jgi:hypothetical protein